MVKVGSSYSEIVDILCVQSTSTSPALAFALVMELAMLKLIANVEFSQIDELGVS
jgi:hypothetical protein